jgi:hypothetical protein
MWRHGARSIRQGCQTRSCVSEGGDIANRYLLRYNLQSYAGLAQLSFGEAKAVMIAQYALSTTEPLHISPHMRV